MICFAILAHENEDALSRQIRNIQKYNGPAAKIVVYNGGTNPAFGKKLCQNARVMYCSYSRPLVWGKLAFFHYDVMRWLEEKKVVYDYLAFLDHDVLFVGGGLEALLNRMLGNGYDCMVSKLHHETDPAKTVWKPGKTMWREWSRWRPFFRSGHFYGTFNPMQVYRHDIIRRMLARINKPQLKQLLRSTNVFALEEILYITLAMLCGGKCREYPTAAVQYLRPFPRISLREARAAKNNPQVMFVHPVKGSHTFNWICRT